jgi:hypothetical protein
MPRRPKVLANRFAWVLLPHPSIPSNVIKTPRFIAFLSLNGVTYALERVTVSQNPTAYKRTEPARPPPLIRARNRAGYFVDKKLKMSICTLLSFSLPFRNQGVDD